MEIRCLECDVSIDEENDEHYSCTCSGTYKALCPAHAMQDHFCPVCGRQMEYHEASITKRLYEEPGLRDLLGF